MEIHHLKLVKTIVEEGNLTLASKKLFLTQSALSHQLKEIESRLGTQLFQRIGKKMILTQAGEKVLNSAKIILKEIDSAKIEIKKLVEGNSGIIRLSTECYTTYHWLPRLMKLFQREFPKIELQIVTEATDDPISYLLDGKLEVAVVSFNKSDYEGNAHLNFTELFTDELILIASKNNSITKRHSIVAKDFKDQTLITYTTPKQNLDIYQKVLNPARVIPKKTIKLELTEAIIGMIKAEMGISVMARWAAEPYLLNNDDLIGVPFRENVMRRTWYAATLKPENQPKYIPTFVEYISGKAVFNYK